MNEDDTFKALRRVPIAELERRLSHASFLLRAHIRMDREELKHEETKKRLNKFINRFIPFYLQPTIKYYSSGFGSFGVTINGQNWKEIFIGTGWEPEEYIAEINKQFDKEDAEYRIKKKVKHQNSLIGSLFSGLIAAGLSWSLGLMISPWIALAIGSVVGLSCGISLTKWLDK